MDTKCKVRAKFMLRGPRRPFEALDTTPDWPIMRSLRLLGSTGTIGLILVTNDT